MQYRVKYVILDGDDDQCGVAVGTVLQYDAAPLLPERGETIVVEGRQGYVIARAYEQRQLEALAPECLNITVYAKAWGEKGGWPALCE